MKSFLQNKRAIALFSVITFILCVLCYFCGKTSIGNSSTNNNITNENKSMPTGNVVQECKNVDFEPDQVFYVQKDSEYSKQIITKEYYDKSTSDEYREMFELYDGPVYEYKFVDQNGLENITLRTIPQIFCIYAGFDGDVTYNKCSWTGRVYNSEGLEYRVGDTEKFETPDGPIEKEIIQIGYYYGVKIR